MGILDDDDDDNDDDDDETSSFRNIIKAYFQSKNNQNDL